MSLWSWCHLGSLTLKQFSLRGGEGYGYNNLFLFYFSSHVFFLQISTRIPQWKKPNRAPDELDDNGNEYVWTNAWRDPNTTDLPDHLENQLTFLQWPFSVARSNRTNFPFSTWVSNQVEGHDFPRIITTCVFYRGIKYIILFYYIYCRYHILPLPHVNDKNIP